MADREPVLLGDRDDVAAPEASASAPSTTEARVEREPARERPARRAPSAAPATRESARPARRPGEGPTVHVAGFWRRLGAAIVDLGVIVPVALILTWVAARIGGIHLPASRTHGIDFWLDLLLASDPALVTWVAMTIGVAAVYLMVFQVTMAQTLGMRLLRMRIIDVWGDRPTVARCGARTAGYLASVATILLGFLWVGFDTEKRALHDWIAGTYVIKA